MDSGQVAGGKADILDYPSRVPWQNIFNLGETEPLNSMFEEKGKRRNIIWKNEYLSMFLNEKCFYKSASVLVDANCHLSS